MYLICNKGKIVTITAEGVCEEGKKRQDLQVISAPQTIEIVDPKGVCPKDTGQTFLGEMK